MDEQDSNSWRKLQQKSVLKGTGLAIWLLIAYSVGLDELPRAFAAIAETGMPGKLMLEF